MMKRHVVLTDDQRSDLEGRSRGRLSLRERNRIQTLLLSADGFTDEEVAGDLGVCVATAVSIRKRFAAEGLEAALRERTELDAKFSRLTDQILGGTRAGTIVWTDTADPDAFRARLKHGTVRVGKAETFIEGEPGDLEYVLTILDRIGRELEEYRPEDDRAVAKLSELWNAARRSARDTAGVLDQLLKETA